jgi:hypothetical protein
LKRRRVRVALLVVLLGAFLNPETSWSRQGGTIQNKPIPTVTFTWSWSSVKPPYYSIAITPMGSVVYESFPNSDLRTGNPYTLEFTASGGLRTRISALVQQLNFFHGRYNIRQNPDPRVASKSLTYTLGVSQNRIIYTSTKDRRIRQLTDLFENISYRKCQAGARCFALPQSEQSGCGAEMARLAGQEK